MHTKTQRRSRLLRAGGLFCVLVFLAVVTARFWLPLPATALLAEDTIGQADCIVPLWGDAPFRFAQAAALYKEGTAEQVCVVLPPENDALAAYEQFSLRIFGVRDSDNRTFTYKAFASFGVPEKAIRFAPQRATSTFEEARAVKEYALQNGYTRVLIVTSTYHMRRALQIFRAMMKGTGIRIYHVTAVNTLYEPASWWRSERDIKRILQEYSSWAHNLVFYFLLGRTSSGLRE